MKYEKVVSIEINCDEARDPSSFAEGLRIIARDIDAGYCSGIVGWSDMVWNLVYEDNEEKDIEK